MPRFASLPLEILKNSPGRQCKTSPWKQNSSYTWLPPHARTHANEQTPQNTSHKLLSLPLDSPTSGPSCIAPTLGTQPNKAHGSDLCGRSRLVVSEGRRHAAKMGHKVPSTLSKMLSCFTALRGPLRHLIRRSLQAYSLRHPSGSLRGFPLASLGALAPEIRSSTRASLMWTSFAGRCRRSARPARRAEERAREGGFGPYALREPCACLMASSHGVLSIRQPDPFASTRGREEANMILGENLRREIGCARALATERDNSTWHSSTQPPPSCAAS